MFAIVFATVFVVVVAAVFDPEFVVVGVATDVVFVGALLLNSLVLLLPPPRSSPPPAAERPSTHEQVSVTLA